MQLLIALFCLVGCNRDTSLTGYDSRLRVRNNSSHSIYYAVSSSYPDTVHYELHVCPKREDNMVVPNSYKTYGAYHNWEWYIDNLPGKKLMVFIYDANQIDSLGDCGTVMANLHADKFVLKRYDVSTEYLKSHDWTIAYE